MARTAGLNEHPKLGQQLLCLYVRIWVVVRSAYDIKCFPSWSAEGKILDFPVNGTGEAIYKPQKLRRNSERQSSTKTNGFGLGREGVREVGRGVGSSVRNVLRASDIISQRRGKEKLWEKSDMLNRHSQNLHKFLRHQGRGSLFPKNSHFLCCCCWTGTRTSAVKSPAT